MAALAALVTVVLWEVVSRRIFNAPTIWAFDLAGYLQAGGFLLAAGELLRRGEHITVDVFSRNLPLRIRAVVDLLASAVLAVAAFWLALIAAKQTLSAWSSGQVDWVSVWAPLVWPYYASIVLAMLSLLLAGICRVSAAANIVLTGRI